MDEIFETATLMQTGKIANFPLVIMGTEFWDDLFDFMRGTMVPEGTIDPEDPDRFLLTDSPQQAVAHVLDVAVSEHGVHRPIKPRRWLRERRPRSRV